MRCVHVKMNMYFNWKKKKMYRKNLFAIKESIKMIFTLINLPRTNSQKQINPFLKKSNYNNRIKDWKLYWNRGKITLLFTPNRVFIMIMTSFQINAFTPNSTPYHLVTNKVLNHDDHGKISYNLFVPISFIRL